VAACGDAAAPPLFELLPPDATGVTFVNELPEAADFNILTYLYYYNGGGVAAGDVNGDGLPDLYFTSNLGSNRLYLNRGNYRFEDVTASAGVTGSPGWTTGAAMADVNGDGHLDIHVSAVNHLNQPGRNILYVNDGDGTFTDRTDEYGLAHSGYSTQAAFFDYDADGDLDMYLLNHATHTERTVSPDARDAARHPLSGDRLFRNDGARFTDVSDAAGILGGGFGLGVVASDINLDGCPDLYIANDFQEDDFLYVNRCDGTFGEMIRTATGHTSRFSMGVDAADFNNDGRPDIVVLDMLPEREDILKTSANAEGFDVYGLRLRAGYHPQFARNTLQLNRGGGRFSDIGYLAGVHATDWSWAALFADLDNDGRKDLFVTNGIYRRPNDLDYINHVGNDAVQATLASDPGGEDLGLLERMPQIPLANYAFRNEGDLTFTNVARAWGLAQPGFSNGAVYVDLNNSGALDLVVSNINAPAAIYRNRAPERGNHSLRIVLRGVGGNTDGIGARVVVRHAGIRQMLEQMPTRGFQSSVDPRLHFGLGASSAVDTLVVVWPDRRFQVLTDIPADRELTLFQDSAAGHYAFEAERKRTQPLLASVPTPPGLDFRHEENPFFDYNREPLMPHQLSMEGPALAVGDVNGDGLDDVYLGGAKQQTGRLYVQQAAGSFRAIETAAFRADSLAEDVDAAFFDANGDGHLDLYVVSGGNEFWGEQRALLDRLYLNDGRGGFRRDEAALPEIFENGCCVAPADFDADGDVDLFVGSRVAARRYGVTPRSYLLENDGTGRFADVTAAKAPSAARAGMVTAAVWLDYDADGALDLVIAGEWMPVTVLRQEDGVLVDRTAAAGLGASHGWWSAIAVTDVQSDGSADLVLGNLGLNSYIRASAQEPARLYVGDFARNGGLEQILTFHKSGVSYPMAGRDDLVKRLPHLRSRYVAYADFGAARLEDILTPGQIDSADVYEARTFASAIAVNAGDGTFRLQPLPVEAQLAPVFAILPDDFDGDGRIDLMLGGNFHGVPPVRGRYDASYGVLLRGDGAGGFTAVDMEASGVMIDGQVRDIEVLRCTNGERLLMIARNDDVPVLLRPLR
jgi:hypothetical protein